MGGMSLAAGTNKGGAAVVASDGGGRLVLGGEVVGAFPGAAFLATGDGEILCANAQAAQLVDAVARDPASGIAALIRSVAVEGRPRVETLDVGHDGRKVETELTLLPLADYRVLVLGKDRTLEVNLRAALIESRQRYKELVEVSSDFAWEVGPDGRFTFVSPKGLLGYAASELVGRIRRTFSTSRPPWARRRRFARGRRSRASRSGCGVPTDARPVC